MKKLIQPSELSENIISLLSKDWMLVTAGNSELFNTMTASWGGIGYLWNKPVVYVFIRPERYTFELMEQHELFSLTIFEKQYKKTLSTLGSKSGRDIDKMHNSGLTASFTELGTPIFEEARLTFECRKLYATMLTEEAFIEQEPLNKWYGNTHGNLHKIYIAEIVNLWINEQ